MERVSHKRIKAINILLMMLVVTAVSLGLVTTPVYAEDGEPEISVWFSSTASYGGDENYQFINNANRTLYSNFIKSGRESKVYISVDGNEVSDKLEITSDDTSVLEIKSVEDQSSNAYWGYAKYLVTFVEKKAGTANLTLKFGNVTRTYVYYCSPKVATIKSMTAYSKNQIRITYEKVPGASGYILYKSMAGWCGTSYGTGEEINDPNQTSVVTDTEWDPEQNVFIVPCFSSEYGKVHYNAQYDSNLASLCSKLSVKDPSTMDVSTSIGSSGKVTISWEGHKDAKNYKIYKSEKENGNYKLLKDCGNNKSVTDIISNRKTFYYKIEMKLESGSVFSKSCSAFYNSETSVSITGYKLNKKLESISENEDSTFVMNGCVVSVGYSYDKKGYIIVDSYNIKTKKVKTKKVKVGNFDYFGGAQLMPDDRIYVVLGYGNSKESDKKTVIKVIKFDKKWKRKGTCSIKGNASNSFKGIVQPFRAGNVDMAYSDGYIYMKTGRLMYGTSDGLHHQSNIQFVINTKKMTYRTSHESYVSHSFKQHVAIKDGTLYQADLGDAYPRALEITITKKYNPANTEGQITSEYEPITFLGDTGDNYVNASLAGLEVGKKYVMACGTSAPHKNKVAGVKGWKLNENVYVTLTDRKTGKSKVVWITQSNPKKKNYDYTVEGFFKVTDDRFVIIYNNKNPNTEKESLYYVMINNSGKVIKKKKLSGISLGYTHTTPVYSNGKIYIVANQFKIEKIKYYGWEITNRNVSATKLYVINVPSK